MKARKADRTGRVKLSGDFSGKTINHQYFNGNLKG
jgi:hypothetical protein